MPPQRKKWGQNFERRFLFFSQDSWIGFHSDSWTLIFSFSKGRGSGFTDLDILDGSFTGIRLVFLDVGLVFLLDFGLTYNVFSFA
jgi:hypothetical protein